MAAVLIGPVLWAPLQAAWPRAAQAQEPPPGADLAPLETSVPLDESAVADAPAIEPAPIEQFGEDAPELLEGVEGVEYTAPTPTGAGKSAATPQAISLPKAEGSVQGMGESFSPVLSSGTATFRVPIALPPGRAGFAPQLALSYSSTGGGSDVGLGWSLGIPFIGRQTDRGVPRYIDEAAWHAQEDRFFFGGGQELVPVSSTAAMLVDCGSSTCAPIPAELTDWQQYRARVEGAYQRFFRSPDSRRWVVQSMDGTRYDFGALPSGGPPELTATAAAAALQSELPLGLGRIYRWMLTRITDPHGSTAYFVYSEHLGERYLSDIYYLSPHDDCGALETAAERMACDASLADYGRRVRFIHEDRPDDATSYLSGWAITMARRVRRIEVSAANGATGARTHVRRYHLQYDPSSFHSLLVSVEIEGRLGTTDSETGVVAGNPDTPEGSLGDAISGPTLPPIRFSYTTQPDCSDEAPGFGGIGCTTVTSPASPNRSVDEARADLFDVNSDGLPDLIVTDPAHYRTEDDAPGVGVFFNGFDGPLAAPAEQAGTFSDPVVMAIPPGLSSSLTLSNANIAPMDIDADGRSDLLHMPRVANYGYFTPARDVAPSSIGSVSPLDQGWRWSYVERAVPPGTTDPRIDLTGDGTHIRAFDVNHDHLIDVVRTTGTSMQTWLNLGLLPEGDGRFGSATYDDGVWTLSTDPIERCLPHAGLPVDFADPEIRLGDMNGDGLQDIVRLHAGSLVYWPGRGDGTWGDGSTDCPPGFAGDREIEVVNPPAELNPELDKVYLADVNADGMDDVVQVRYSAIDVWFNKAGLEFTERVIATGAPFAPAFANRVRIVDLDGSSTADVLYGTSGNWRWVDLMGGQRPRLLQTVIGSLGAETALAYGSSAEDYLADLRDAAGCLASDCDRFTWESLPGDCDQKVIDGSGDCVFRTGGSPVVSTVVRSTTTASGLGDPLIVNAYAYHDGYYDGAEHEFRGFGAATEEAIGDTNHPTSFTRTFFHQGRRASEIASDLLADNPDEPLKAEPYRTEIWKQDGDYLSTTHRTLTIRDLHPGLDGRTVRAAFESQSDQLLYDVAGFEANGDTLTVPHVVRPTATEETDLIIRATVYAHTRTTADSVDNLGQPVQTTAHGRITPETPGEDMPDETIENHAEYVNVDDSATGWLWRPSQTWVEGHGDTTPLGLTDLEYNDTGDVISSTIDVQGGGYSFAPTLGSPSPEDIVVTKVVDAWGNPTASCVGGDAASGDDCLRYGTVAYETDYAAFPESEAQGVRRNGSGWDLLTTTAEWDRGLGALMSVTDPNEDGSTVTYDGFGRLTSLTPPPVVGCDEGTATTRVAYALAEPGETPVSRVTTTAVLSCDGEESIESTAYIDGLGRARAVIATGDGTTGREWVKTGAIDFDARGTVARAYDPEFYSGSTTDLLAAVAPAGSADIETTYDAFGRPALTIERDGYIVTSIVYHALSRAILDWHDLDATSPHVNTPTIERVDGHGRTIDQVVINKQPGSTEPEYHHLFTWYRADGAVIAAMRALTTSDEPFGVTTVSAGVDRSFAYDTAGRRIASTNYDTDNYATSPIGVWRYLFNRASDLVAVRDPRGCGQDFYYDHAGRPLGEKYIDCSEGMTKYDPSETMPSGAVLWTETTTSDSVHVRTIYDAYDDCWEPDPTGLDDYPTDDAAGMLGRVACTADRGQRSLFAYGRRGQLIWQARQVLFLGDLGNIAGTLSTLPTLPAKWTTTRQSVIYDEVHTWVATRTYDHGGRARALVLPPALGYYTTPRRVGRIDFGPRGLPSASAIDLVSDATGFTVTDGAISWTGATIDTHPVVTELEYDPDGQVTETTYGDTVGGSRDATVSTIEYDIRRRPDHASTVREPTGSGSGRPLAAVDVPFDQTLTWDPVNNLELITDNRDANKWPAGQRPQNVELEYDSLYHVVNADYTYNQDSGGPTSQDDASDWRAEHDQIRASDNVRPLTPAMAPVLPDDRVVNLQWAYDWLGNMTFWNDDANSFYERSLTSSDAPPIGHAEDRPSALLVASNMTGPSSDRGGYVELTYGVSGNVATMTVHAQCEDVAPATCEDPGGSTSSRLSTLHADCRCAVEQHHQYLWDELNRLVEARRYDRTGGTGNWTLQVAALIAYDSANQRIVRLTYQHGESSPSIKYNVEVFPGDFELHDTYFAYFSGALGYWPESALGTETHHLLAGARVVWDHTSETSGLDDSHRITVPLADLIGTTAAVLDLRSGALVETSTYYPNGARETFRTDPSYSILPERQGFTGKEADEEIGAIYFGERWLIPRLGRWLSPDPLAIHALGGGEAMNSFHYVAGSLVQARDPIGLKEVGAIAVSGIRNVPLIGPHTNDDQIVANMHAEFFGRIADLHFDEHPHALFAPSPGLDQPGETNILLLKGGVAGDFAFEITTDPAKNFATMRAYDVWQTRLAAAEDALQLIGMVPIGGPLIRAAHAFLRGDYAQALAFAVVAAAEGYGGVNAGFLGSKNYFRVNNAEAVADVAFSPRSLGASANLIARLRNDGGRNAAFLRQAETWTDAQLKRSSRSFAQQIDGHYAKIDDPSAIYKNWSTMDPRHQQGAIRHWEKEIENFAEQQQIVDELLRERGSSP